MKTTFTESVIERAQKLQNSLVLPESYEKRILHAAKGIQEERIASRICFLGNKDRIRQLLKDEDIVLDEDKIDIIDPEHSQDRDAFAQQYYQHRKHKGMTEEKAFETMKNPLYYAAMLLRAGRYHSIVAGAINTTANVLRSALQVIGVKPNMTRISSSFVVESQEKEIGENGCLVFSDCAIIPRPSSEDLVQIALAASETCKTYLKVDTRLAFLSFSTLGSAEHEEVLRVRKAAQMFRAQYPSIASEGELQLDAALSPRVAKTKAADSPIAGRANTLIFPDLASGNIAYKCSQIFGKTAAYGPIIQGLAAPVSDLSRSCTAKEIVISSAMTLLQESSIEGKKHK